MPLSGDKFSTAPRVDGQGLAVVAESLYLTNLLLAPGIAFAVLAWLCALPAAAASLSFGGYAWDVRNGGGGPGPNT